MGNLTTAQEGQITDRFTKAIAQLGAIDKNNQPQMELRLGGIYALESIARKSPEYYWPVMEVLTAYVRSHAPRTDKNEDLRVAWIIATLKSRKPPLPPNATPSPSGTPVPLLLPPPSPDIQAILDVIRRRDTSFEQRRNEHLSLFKADLKKADLSGANLSGVILTRANLTDAVLAITNLHDANLTDAVLVDTNFDDADLRGANLSGAYMFGTSFIRADLTRADLSNTNLDFYSANIEKADLSGANLYYVKGLTQEELNSAHGNEHTKLPPGLVRPSYTWRPSLLSAGVKCRPISCQACRLTKPSFCETHALKC